MISSGGQYYSLCGTEGLFLKFKIFFAIIWFHMVLVTSQQDQINFKLSPPPTASTDNSTSSAGTTLAADASIMTLITSPNGTPEVAEVETTSLDGTSNVLSTLSRAEKSKITIFKTSNTSGVKSHSNICNLSSVCSDSVFYRGEMIFEDHEDSNITQNNQDAVNDTLIEDLPLNKTKFSEFDKTLKSLSESYFIACDTQNQSTSNCTFTIKVNMTVNICPLLFTSKRIEIHQIEQCCCSFKAHCPSSPKELKELQCALQDLVVCRDDTSHLPSPVFPPPGKSIPVSPLATFSSKITPIFIPPNISSGNRLRTPFIQSATWDIHISPTQPSSQTATGLPQPEYSTSTTLETTSSPTILSINSSVLSTTLSTSVTDPSTSLPHGITENFTTSDISASEIENKVSQMEKSLDSDSLEPSLAEEMIREVSRLLHAPPALLNPLSQRLLKVVADIGLKLNFSNKTISFTSPSLALAVIKANASTFAKTTFAAQDPSNLQVTLDTQAPENSIGIITLPTQLLDNLSAEEAEIASRIQFNFFETPTLFQDPSLENLSLISYVISSSVTNLTIRDLTTNVTVMLQNTSPNQDNLTVKCAFWDLSKNGGRGGWSSEGCTVKDKRINETICSCNHLTSFGVLLDLSRTPLPPIQMLVLTFITYIGCGLSAIFLSVTLVTYIAFEKIRRDYPSKILIQLCAALLLLNLVFLLDSWIALYNIRGLCISVAVFLHYFLLVSFTWMGLEAFHMYLALVKVFNTYIRKYILKFCIVGWGVPAVIIAIVLAISPDNYGLGSYGKFPNGSPDEFCWINNSVVFYITVVGYFCVIFLLNISMFIVVLVQLCRIKKKKQLGAQRKTSIQDLRSVAGLTFLLGITWGFAFFAWGPVNLLFMYLFAIFNTLQGFFIFIFYCVAKENVRKQWRRYLCCGRYRLAENSDWSRTATNGLKKQIVNQGVSSSSNSLQSNSNSTNSTTLLVNNDCSVHANGNGNASTERNGVSFSVQNGDVCLHDFSGKQHGFNEKEDPCNSKNRISLRRTSKRGSLHFVEQM
ncbi:adhesion G-protein coupled receptor G2 isoform X1 [Phascolarctos cinereus]|uniref:Adhesion G-protein coupled receptor G2 n=1 Tax=Phascolarctos cinereus TaxID=38626 RepID=A0A6P5M3M4_PHACI|nr:adhesion G-protein coupled receptor G2 isoform X1 [Phascolarctos cinereus]XP_020863115.1 adhesion G-protein coupled receptor G2 isoform X1 [Phascolarctos cinereus]